MQTLLQCALVAAFVVLIVAQSDVKTIRCGPSHACFPMGGNIGPACVRGSRMNLRFSLQLAPDNYVVRDGQVITNVTYAFCPVVDELQAFNLSRSLQLVGTKAPLANRAFAGSDKEGGENGTLAEWLTQAYVNVHGMGQVANIMRPNVSSDAMVMVADNMTTGICTGGGIPVVPFLILNITMKDGRYQYFAEQEQPYGVGFHPTCSPNDVCLLDADMPCIGEEGRRNCAQCYDFADDIANTNIQIWASYYGTDRSGKAFFSGFNNPLNFREYSGSGVYSALSRDLGKIKDGELSEDSTIYAGGGGDGTIGG